MSLSLLLLLSHTGFAGTDVWLDKDPGAVQSTGNTAVSVAAVTPDLGWTPSDERALAFLSEELKAVKPLADVFDGELQIMLRLQTALGDITALRPEDRDLVYNALMFQGFAVHRYFQDKLGTDPEAAPYRTTIGDKVEVAAWVDAIALNPDATPDATQIPEKTELLAFQELRARLLLTPVATLVADGLPADGRLIVDGREVATDKARVPPGFHRVELSVKGAVRQRQSFRVAPGETQTVILPATATELRDLATSLKRRPDAIQLSPGVVAVLQPLAPPVQLVMLGGTEPTHYAVVGDRANRVEAAKLPGDDAPWGVARVSVGGGWFYDGSFFLENDGAPHTKATVNAGTPVGSFGLELRPLRYLAVGAGADLALPLGDYHSVPVGESQERPRPYPHLALGLPWVQVTGGILFPWHLGIGVRAHIPLGSTLELNAAYVYGQGLTLDRQFGPQFQATPVQTAWVTIGAHLDARSG